MKKILKAALTTLLLAAPAITSTASAQTWIPCWQNCTPQSFTISASPSSVTLSRNTGQWVQINIKNANGTTPASTITTPSGSWSGISLKAKESVVTAPGTCGCTPTTPRSLNGTTPA